MTGSHLHLKKVPDETVTIFTFCLCKEILTWLQYPPFACPDICLKFNIIQFKILRSSTADTQHTRKHAPASDVRLFISLKAHGCN